MKEESDQVTALRDAIVSGLVEEVSGCVRAVGGVLFPVEDQAHEIFVRDCYPIFFKYFEEKVFPDKACPGKICRGPPGVGKVVYYIVV